MLNGKSELKPLTFRDISSSAALLLPLFLLIGTGLRGLDLGLHWDERPYQIGPVKRMVERGTPLPGYYNYPSFDYWLNLLVLSPDVVSESAPGETLRQHLLRVLDSHAYLLRLRAVYLCVTSLSLIWVYLLVLQVRGSRLQALLAASLMAGSWEVAYHLRWIATDGMLMQFAILTVLLAVRALHTRSNVWLIIAAIVSGFGAATKYPGGLLVLPVVLTAWFISRPGREKAFCLIKVVTIFALVYLAITPATILQPSKLVHAVFYEMKHYATGHGGHTVNRGLEHFGRMFSYFATVLWSHYILIALLFFALGIIGAIALVRQERRQSVVLLAFPAAYLFYFGVQGTMVVRNLLAVVPFFAVVAACGADLVADVLSRYESSSYRGRFGWLRIIWAALLIVCLGFNACWLVNSANSIVARHTDRFTRETAEYIRTHSHSIFLFSPRVELALAARTPALENVTVDPSHADAFVLYAHEGMQRWHDWPANQRNLTLASFGPREVNINFYPGWWGNDHIVVISRRRAAEIGLHIAAISRDATLVLEETQAQSRGQPPETVGQIPPESLPGSWASNGMATNYLPAIDPRSLVSSGEAQTIIAPSVFGPASGGWELDGRACTFVSPQGLIISLTVISTNAFALQRFDPGSTTVSDVGLAAYTIRGDPPGDLRLFARTLKSAVVVHVSGHPNSDDNEIKAQAIAIKALDKLDRIGDSRRRDEEFQRRSGAN
jgi:4-amino-4-deoxy-L-arabinose transferase-like glycosyltransferase